jgi:hypothetical protein
MRSFYASGLYSLCMMPLAKADSAAASIMLRIRSTIRALIGSYSGKPVLNRAWKKIRLDGYLPSEGARILATPASNC